MHSRKISLLRAIQQKREKTLLCDLLGTKSCSSTQARSEIHVLPASFLNSAGSGHKCRAISSRVVMMTYCFLSIKSTQPQQLSGEKKTPTSTFPYLTFSGDFPPLQVMLQLTKKKKNNTNPPDSKQGGGAFPQPHHSMGSRLLVQSKTTQLGIPELPCLIALHLTERDGPCMQTVGVCSCNLFGGVKPFERAVRGQAGFLNYFSDITSQSCDSFGSNKR